MKQIRKRLTYANVMSSLAIFLILGGATAFAASQLGKNTVGSKQLKKNAVTKAKIKKGAVSTDKLADGAVTEGKLGAGAVTEAKIGGGAVTEAKVKDGAITGGKLGDNSVSTGKIQNGAITGDKIAPGAVTGAAINDGTTPFAQIVNQVALPGPLNLQSSGPVFLGSDIQPANEDDRYFGGLDVTFSAGCAQPRTAAVYLMIDPQNPAAPAPDNLAGIGVVTDQNAGTVTRHLEIGDYGIGGSGGLQRSGLGTSQSHSFFLYIAAGSCNSGSGISGANARIDVVGVE